MMSSATPSPKSPASPAGPRRPAASWRRRPAAASAPHRLPRPRQPAGEHRQGLQEGWEAGDIGALIGLLDLGATLTGDGGGLVPAAPGRSKAASGSRATWPI